MRLGAIPYLGLCPPLLSGKVFCCRWREAKGTMIALVYNPIAACLSVTTLKHEKTKGIETTGMTQDLVPLKQDTALRIVLVVFTTFAPFVSFSLCEFCFFLCQISTCHVQCRISCLLWNDVNLASRLCVCCFLRGLQRIELLTTWTWTRSRKDSKQPCRSFNHR